jgi:riboflavin kinase/FMN adenylyltransferase
LVGEPVREPVCTVGVFDGVHRGHRQVFYEMRAWADAVGGQTCIVTFDRHPLEILRGVSIPLLMTLEQRLLEFERHGIDAVLLLDFKGVKELSPEAFLKDVVLDGIGARRLLLGFDSHIGKDRAGDSATLPALGKKLGIEVRIASRVLDREGRKVGSSAIREAIQRGDLDAAANMLGHPMTLRGTVVRGAGRGRGLGTATANLEVPGIVLPPDGVYLVRVFWGERTAPGVANLGVRPTFGGTEPRSLEVHVPGWDRDLYGEALEVRLVRLLRPEQRFEDAEALKRQIQQDLGALQQAVESGEI